MKNKLKPFWGLLFALVVLAPLAAGAHQPNIVTQSPTAVTDPEISRAYYGRLSGAPQIFQIYSPQEFTFYAGLLIPDRPGQKQDVSAEIYRIIETEEGIEYSPIAFLDGNNFDWQPYYEEFGADYYFNGPEFEQQLPEGNYEIKVFSPENDSRYSLAIGKIESFPPSIIIKTLIIVPQLKRDFFASSPFTFLKSPFGIAYVVIMLVLAFIVGFIYKIIARKVSRQEVRRRRRNIGTRDRLTRLVIGVILLLLGIYFWNPVILFLAGFLLFEAAFSWCALYAALGKNSCPL